MPGSRGIGNHQGLTNSTRDDVAHKPVFSLHLQHGVEEVATGGLLGKSQRSLEPVPLLVGVELRLAASIMKSPTFNVTTT